MKFRFLILTALLLFSSPLFAQHPLGIKNYPPIKYDGKPTLYDWTEINNLLDEGQPNAAGKVAEKMQKQAIADRNLSEFWHTMEVFDRVLSENYLEENEQERWIWQFSERADSLPFPMNNIAHLYLADWVKSSVIKSNDESLNWKMGKERFRIGENGTNTLSNYHLERSLDNPEELMQWGIKFAMYTQELPDYIDETYWENRLKMTPTLFDYLAERYIYFHREDFNAYNYYRWDANGNPDAQSFKDSLSFGLAENLPLSTDYSTIKNWVLPLFQARELLAWNNNRMYEYAHTVESRLRYVNEYYDGAGTANEHMNEAFEQAEGQLLRRDDPASSVFTHLIANKLTEDGKAYHWKTNTEPKDALVKALRKVDYSLTKYPKSEEAENLRDLKKVILDSEASFNLKAKLIRNKSQLLEVNYRNMTTGVVTVYKIKKHVIVDGTTNALRDLQLQKVYTQNLNFDADPNMLPHTKDFILPAFAENGEYLVILTPSEAKRDEVIAADTLYKHREYSYRIVHVSQLIVKNATENGKSTLMVVDKISGKPIAGAKVKFTRTSYSMGERKEVLLKTTTTDKNGMVEADYSNSFNYTIYYKDDSASNYLYNYYYPNNESLKTKVEIFTDRAIYRPGQTVYYKVIAYEDHDTKQQVVENFQVRIKAFDYNDQQLASETGRTNNYGSWSGSFQLPTSGFLQGSIRLEINEGTGRHDIMVEEYKRPTFEIVLDTVKTPYALGDSITISGKVSALAGYGIGGAKVTVNVSEQRYLPWDYRGKVSSYDDHQYAVVADPSGAFKVTFPTEKSKDVYGVSYNIAIDAVSGTGETQNFDDYFYVGKNRLSIAVFAGSQLFNNEKNKLSVLVSNSSSVEQKDAVVNYKIERAVNGYFQKTDVIEAEYKEFDEAQFHSAFPELLYYEKEQTKPYTLVSSGTLHSSDSLLLGDLHLQPGNYRFTGTVKDETGTEVLAEHYFSWIDLKSAKNQHEEGLWSHLSNNNPKPGEKVTLTIGTSVAALPVYVEVFDGIKRISAQWMTIKKRGQLVIPVKEGIQSLYISMIAQNNDNHYTQSAYCTIAGMNESLLVKMETKRDFLRPGTKEEWTMTVSNWDKNPVPAELLVAMYDASLDELASNYWNSMLHYAPYFSHYWNITYTDALGYPNGNWRSNHYYPSGYDSYGWAETRSYGAVSGGFDNYFAADAISANATYSLDQSGGYGFSAPPPPPGEGKNKDEVTKALEEEEKPGRVKAPVRTNFNETAFFYPSILPGSDNTYRFNFTVPDALTRWRLMAMAHTKNLQTGYGEWNFATRKEVMVMPNVPRFYKEGDVVEFSAKVSNLSDQPANTTTRLRFIDPYTEKDITADFGSLQPINSSIRSKESADVFWKFTVPKGHTLIAYVIETTSGQYSDAEQRAIPVLSNKVQLTESKAFTKTTVGPSTFKLDKVDKLGAGTEKISLKLEIQTQPLWTTLMSLPYLIEYPYECAEQTFARYYGNVLARKIIQDNPNFQRIIASWKSDDPKAFMAELEKNPELKAIMLSETPWVLDARSESEQRARLAILFDENQLNASIEETWKKLMDMRAPDGCWGWFGKENSNVYITQHIVNGFVQLSEMGVEVDLEPLDQIVTRLDSIYTRQFRKLTDKDKKAFAGLDDLTIDWIIARNYFGKNDNAAVKYYRLCMEKNWKSYGLYTQAEIGLDAVYSKNKALADKIRKSLLDRAIRNPEMGMYWRDNTYGYYWTQAVIETQSQLIRFFAEYGNGEKEVREMQLWLLQNKRSNCWETTKATTNACYALLIDKSTEAAYRTQVVKARLADGTNLGIIKNDSGFERTWTGSDITAGKAEVTVESSTDAPVFGAIHVTYLSEQSVVEKSNGDIRVERHIYHTVNGKLEEIKAGETVEAGTRLTVKVTVTTNRSLEFVHVRSPHAFGFEVTDQLSGYRYGDVAYYQVNRDASAELFADYLKKGSSTFSYEVFATGRGELTVGPAIAECMYAPVFRANSSGTNLKVK